MLLRERCQRENLISDLPWPRRIERRLRSGPIPVKQRVAALFKGRFSPPNVGLGKPSVFHEGQIVRVRGSLEIQATLDAKGCTRGLLFMAQQWPSCGRSYRVQTVLRRMIDDAGRMRAVSRTVILAGLTCSSFDAPDACGRECPLFFRDEWLEPSDEPAEESTVTDPVLFARIRGEAEIRATLDPGGGRDGLKFMPEMLRFAGLRLPVARKVARSGEYDNIYPVTKPFYVLAGAACSGAALGNEGPCQRRCALLWHGDWLVLEPAVLSATASPPLSPTAAVEAERPRANG